MSYRTAKHSLKPFEWRNAIAAADGKGGRLLLSPLTTLVLHELARRVKTEKGTPWGNLRPTLKELAAATRLSKSALLRHIKIAEEQGWIERIPAEKSSRYGSDWEYIPLIPDVMQPKDKGNTQEFFKGTKQTEGDMRGKYDLVDGQEFIDHKGLARIYVYKDFKSAIGLKSRGLAEDWQLDYIAACDFEIARLAKQFHALPAGKSTSLPLTDKNMLPPKFVADELCEAFARVKKTMKLAEGEASYNSWFKSLCIYEGVLGGDSITMVAPTTFMRDWILSHYSQRLHEAWGAEGIENFEIIVGRVASRDLHYGG